MWHLVNRVFLLFSMSIVLREFGLYLNFSLTDFISTLQYVVFIGCACCHVCRFARSRGRSKRFRVLATLLTCRVVQICTNTLTFLVDFDLMFSPCVDMMSIWLFGCVLLHILCFNIKLFSCGRCFHR